MQADTVADLFRRYGNDVFRLAYSYLHNRADAEDVCQNVFIKLNELPYDLTPGKEKHWLLKCTANASKNHLRFLRRHEADELSEEIVFSDPVDSTLHDAVRSLPKMYRMVVHLYYYEGYDQREIASVLRISRTAVQTRMSRARAILRKELNDHDPR